MVRKLALLTCIAILASLPIPMWTATQTALIGASRFPAVKWGAIFLAYLFAAIPPVFYFALWRQPEVPRISGALRLLCLAGAGCGVIVVAAGLPVTTLKTALSDLATLSCVALLVVLSRGGNRGSSEVSGFLRRVTGIAIIAGTIWLAINMLAFVLSGYRGRFQTLLDQACLFTAPLLVFVSTPRD